jgi:hypothetical protein
MDAAFTLHIVGASMDKKKINNSSLYLMKEKQ